MGTIIYCVNNAKDGSTIAMTQSYEKALAMQDELWKEHNIDTYITKG